MRGAAPAAPLVVDTDQASALKLIDASVVVPPDWLSEYSLATHDAAPPLHAVELNVMYCVQGHGYPA